MTKNFDNFLKEALKYDNIKNIHITTNGTVMQNESILSIIKNNVNRFVVNVSNYETNQSARVIEKRSKILEIFKDILGKRITEGRGMWTQASQPQYNNRNEEQLSDYFIKCLDTHVPYYLSLWGGRLYSCAKHGVYDLLGFKLDENDYLDLNDFPEANLFQDSQYKNKYPVLRDSLLNYLQKSMYSACNYCNNIEDSAKPRVAPGEQIK